MDVRLGFVHDAFNVVAASSDDVAVVGVRHIHFHYHAVALKNFHSEKHMVGKIAASLTFASSTAITLSFTRRTSSLRPTIRTCGSENKRSVIWSANLSCDDARFIVVKVKIVFFEEFLILRLVESVVKIRMRSF